MTNAITAGFRLYRHRDLKARGISFTPKHIRTLERAGRFPRRIDLGEHSVAWVAEEVDAWVEQKVRARQPAVNASL
jgi:prophage regulatory protein